MKQNYISRIIIFSAMLFGLDMSAYAQSTTFNYTGAVQYYTIPAGVTSISIDCIGARGGPSPYNVGGLGGRVQATMTVTPGQVLNIYVGATAPSTNGSAGGGNGTGFTGGYGYSMGAGGGACSEIQSSTGTRLIVAGGGGGGGWECTSDHGGAGGGLTGGNGLNCGSYSSTYDGSGGTQVGGGACGTNGGGAAAGSGASGGTSNTSGTGWAGGGGSGYFGGGGASYYGGGGGGSSYPAAVGGNITALVHTQGYNNSGNGSVIISPPPPPGTSVFGYTGSIQTYSVGTGINFISIDMQGAQGGNSYSTYGQGGCGGRVRATLAVTPGQVYYVYVGQAGVAGNGSSCCTVIPGGWNGGGGSGGYYYCGAGGGATDIRFGGTAISNRIFVAGGGGGGGYNCSPNGENGGAGGGLTGQTGFYCSSQTSCMCYIPTGGTQTVGGNNGTCIGGTASTQGTGGNGMYYAGGGGGGYWGGGGGYYYGSGAGGSSYPATASGNITGLIHTQGYNCSGNGTCTIAPAATASTLTVFAYTGTIQTYTVPAGITSCSVDVNGAKGGNAYNGYGTGGCGGEITATLAVTPGQILYVYAGGVGVNGDGNSTVKAGGWNGGGSVGAYPYGAGGGGASDIRTGGTAISNRLIVAGGGGGGGYNCGSGNNGGMGGGLTGQNGLSCNSTTYCMCYNPTGGTQTAGGNNGTCLGGSASTQGTGANSGYYGGAGGGGYWGGGGAYYYAGGGGGSNYSNPTYATGVTNTQGSNCGGAGVVYISPICTAGTITGTASTCAGFTTTLTDATTGGAWTSSTTTIATVNSSGVVTGVATGTATISYGGVLACGTVYTTKVVTVSAPPTAITPAVVCQSLSSTFTSSAGGTWSSASTTIATATGSGASGTVTGVAPGATTITYAISATCYVTTPITVNPTAPITGPTTVCSGLTITLSDGITGGTWTSSNTSAATVDPVTGIVTGVVGTLVATPVTISYTLPTTCARTYPITVNPLPAVFTGPGAVCQGLTITLGETSVGGTWASSNTAQATVGTTGIVTGIAGYSAPIITYTLPTGCIMIQTVSVNPLPVPITTTGGSCVTNLVNPTVTLVDGTPGGSWSVSNTALATIISFSGQITGLAPGALTVTYTLPTTCLITAPYVINPLPAPVSGTPVLCSNAITYLSNTSTGGTWSSSDNTIATVGSGTGVVSGVSGAGNPSLASISYTLPTGCLAIASISVNPAPGTPIGTTNVCVNSTTTLTVGGGCAWTSSNPGLATVPLGPSTSGTITGLIAGVPIITYTIPLTGCFNTTAVTVNPVPAGITGPTGVCFGSTITLNDATTGGLWSSGTPTTASISAGGGLVTPVLAAGGPVTMSYTLGTGCKATYPINVNPLPIPYPVSPTGTSSYCAGVIGGGVDIKMFTTTAGVNYQLYIGGLAWGTALPGGGVVDFGLQTTAATYSVVGTYAATGCAKNMSNSPVININPTPTVYNLSFTGTSSNYCDYPGAGVDLTLSGSQLGVFYTINLNGSYFFNAMGTGALLDFGTQSALGTYTASADNGTCQSNMTGSVTVGKYPLPTAQTVTVQDIGLGAGNYCASGLGLRVDLLFGSTGVNYQLFDTTTHTLLTTVSGANSSLSFGVWSVPSGTTHVYNVVGINSITGCTNNMNNYVSITSLPLPTVYAVTAPSGSSYCIGGNGDTIEVGGSDIGINYQLILNGTTLVGSAVPGTTSAIYYPNITTAGTYTVMASNVLNGCSSNMAGSINVATYPALKVYTVTVDAPGSVCTGDSLHVRLSGSTPGISYMLYCNLVPVNTTTGTGGVLDFGRWATGGAYTVIAENMLLGCTANMIGAPTITVNSLPKVYAVSATNSGNYCAGGAGQHISLSFSDVGVNYQLYVGGTTKVGSPVAGSGASIDFGAFTTPGTYTITGTNSITNCSSNMSGSAVITVNPLPSVYLVTGGGSYCAGSTTGVLVGLSNSNAGINYQLLNGTSSVGTATAGTGSALNFGLQTATGSYSVIATDAVTGCTQNMSGSKVITINPLPNVYAVTGGGAYCGGGTGVHVGLTNSTTGVQYQLSNGLTLISTLAGTTGMPLDFGLQTAAGTYTVSASNLLTSCGSNMTGSATVVVNAVPLVFTVKGGGSYCSGDKGADIYLSGSEPGINYQLYSGGAATGSPVMGTGGVLDLGYKTAAGTYTVVAYNSATGCNMNMTGSAAISINSLPAVYTVTGGGTMCAGGVGYHVNLSGSATGISYRLFNPGLVSTMTGTGAALDFGAQTSGGTYTVVATNTTTGCVSNMSGSSTIVVNPAPATFAVTGGGHYCADASGVPVGLAGSVSGVNYQLLIGGSPSGMPVGGTGTVLNFGLQKVAGTYTIVGNDLTTTCSAKMTGSVAVVIDPMVTPSVSITGTDGTACIGQVTNYTASAVNGGSAPTYIWKVGSSAVGMTSGYSYIPTNGDVVSVTMTSNANCASPTIVTGSVTMNVIPYVMPSATIATDPGNSVCQGTPVAFTAAPLLGGTAPGYSWLRNNAFVGTGLSYSYTPNAGNNGDVITFMLISNQRCRMMDTVFSDPVAMSVDDASAPAVTLISRLGKIVGVGLVDTFTATITKPVPGSTYTYQWYIDGAVVNGENMPIFIDHNVFNNDNVSVIVTRNGVCGSQSGTTFTIVQLHNLGTNQVTTSNSNVSVLPNPSKGEFTIKGTLGTSKDEEVSLEIANMLGQVIYKDKVMTHNGNINEHIKLSNSLANGMYILSLHSDSANDVFHIVIEQ